MYECPEQQLFKILMETVWSKIFAINIACSRSVKGIVYNDLFKISVNFMM